MRTVFIYAFIVLVSFGLIACENGGSADQTESPTAKRYPFKGEIVKIDKAAKKATINHEKIEGYMDAMTMDLEIRKPDWVWNELVKGSVVTGDLVVDNAKGEYWVEVTGVIAPQDSSQERSPTAEDKAIIGKKLPAFSLTNQDGKTISPDNFKGKGLAITFIYAQCPLPAYCILMSKNFSDLANQINAEEELKNTYRLLSISFDPARDTPEKLKSYGIGYLGRGSKATDFVVWQLAVGEDKEVRKIADFAGLRYEVDEKDKTQFTHSLRTLVVAPDGTIKKVFTGNDWKAEDLLREMKSAMNAESGEK
ncbi:MAG: redoxin domain-containing protein [Pyrinomonadaceae bacterium]|nr:redoxin domain-containing protein [Pyrinomonadaceae bacterium]